MKKLLSLIAVLVLGISTTFAQSPATAPISKQTGKKVVGVKTEARKVETKTVAAKTTAPVKTEIKKVESKTVATKTKAPVVTQKEVKKATTTSSSVKLKADGTPDMRYADNKGNKAVTAGPTKKDGTADMRYKANTAVKKN